jgi:hypothetical protein
MTMPKKRSHREALVETHKALNDLAALVYRDADIGGIGCCDRAIALVKRNQEEFRDLALPVTLGFFPNWRDRLRNGG